MEVDKKPEVSIVVPVYNVGPYVRQCFESIEGQTFKDWECIVVDDGSTDGSGKICDEFAYRDPRFRVFHVQNEGLSSARNNGIRIAEGRFITFCDSDDWYAPDAIETMYRIIIESGADIVQTGWWNEYDGHRRLKRPTEQRMILDRQQTLLELINDKIIPSYMWNKMFHRDVVAPDFPEGKTFEDIFVCTRWFPKISRMVIDPIPLYHYRMRKGSILHSDSSKYQLDFLNAKRFRADEILKHGLDGFSQKDHDVHLIKAAVKAAKRVAREEKDTVKRNEILKSISSDLTGLQIPDAKKLGRKLRFRANLLRSNPRMFERLMRFLGKTDLHSKYRTRHLFP